MNFWQLSDGIRPQHRAHQEHDGHHAHGAGWPASLSDTIGTGDNAAGDGGNGFFSGLVLNAPDAIVSPVDAAQAGVQGHSEAHQFNWVQIDQHAVQMAGIGGNGGNDNSALGGTVSQLAPAPGAASVHAGLGSGTVETGSNTAGNGGDGYFHGSIIHASMVVYEPINISVSAGYGSIALANQTNDVSINQSAVQIAGIGGNGGDHNIAVGGNAGLSSSGSDAITTGHNSAGNGDSGSFSGSLLDAPVVIYHPINLALAGPGGTAEASQSNAVEIDQSVLQMAGIGGNGGSGNVAGGGDLSTAGSGSLLGGWQFLQTGGNEAGNGGNGTFHGDLVHTSVAVFDPVNISVAGYNSTADAHQTNNVNLDQSSSQMAGIGGSGGSGNIASGGMLLSKFAGHADTIATGGNGAGDGGSGHFSGSLVDVSIAIYAPINIAIAGPHSTAEADQINRVHFDQSSVQIAGIGGDGGNGNMALGGDLAAHLLSDLHLVA